MNPNTGDPDDDAPDDDDDDASSPNFLIIDSSLKCKIDPKSMLKQTKNDSPWYQLWQGQSLFQRNQCCPHRPNDVTAPDAAAATAENKTSVRQLLDIQEYTVSKFGIIKKGCRRKEYVDQCVSYLHGISQILVCPR